jgi:ribonucleoside-diphosphate reductase beta chain
MQAKLAELLPIAATVLVPKGADPFGEWTLLGYDSAKVNEFAFTALSRRLRVIGVGLPEVAPA